MSAPGWIDREHLIRITGLPSPVLPVGRSSAVRSLFGIA